MRLEDGAHSIIVFLRHGVDLEINWAGRIGVFWIMAGIFFAMVFAGWVPTAFLLFGLFMALILGMPSYVVHLFGNELAGVENIAVTRS